MATITAAAGGGNWTAGATWVGGVHPTAADDVLLTGTSGNVTIDTGAVGRSLNATGYTGTLTHTAGVTLTLGDATAGASNVALLLVAGMTYTLGSNTTSVISLVTSTASTTAQTITTGGKSLGGLTLTGPASKLLSFTFADAAAILGTLTITGNSAVNRLFVTSGTPGTPRTLTVGTGFSLANVTFMDIVAAGAAGTPWTGTSMGNALGNSNITFDAPTTQTNTGATATWSTAANWTSRVPLPQDTVVINTGSGTITADIPHLGAGVDFTGFTGTLVDGVGVSCYGSLTLVSGMTLTSTHTWNFRGRSVFTLTTGGKSIGTVTIEAPGGTYTLGDNLTTASAVASSFLLSHGGFNDGGHQVSTFNVDANNVNTRALTMSGTWLINATGTSAIWVAAVGGMTLVATGSTITVNATSVGDRSFIGGGYTYGTLTHTLAGSTGALKITGSNTFNTINFSDASNARSLLFTAATTTTITGAFNVVGTSGKLMTIDSITAATHTLTKASGAVSDDFLSVAHSVAQGGAGWFAGAHSVDGGNNKGWYFSVQETPPMSSHQLMAA